MSGFTKGKWEYEDSESYAIYSDEVNQICTMSYDCDEIPVSEINANANLIVECFNRIRPKCAVSVDGGMKDDDRSSRLKAFESGQHQFLINVSIANQFRRFGKT